MEAPYFPVAFHLLKEKLDFRCERPDMELGNCSFDGMEMYTVPLNHPNGGYGYKFIESGKALVYLSDNELRFQHEGGLSREQYVEF